MVIKWANMVNLQKVFLCKVEPFVPNIDRPGFLMNLFSKFGGPKIRIFGGF